MLSEIWSHLRNYLYFNPSLLADPEIGLRLLLQFFLLCGSAFFSCTETALFSLSDVDLEDLRKKHHPRADQLHDLLSQPRHLIVSILCGNELINIAATANMTGVLLMLYGAERAAVISMLVMVPLLLLFGEITPKTIAVSYPVGVSTRVVSAPMSIWVRVITPLRWMVRLVAEYFTTLIVGKARDPGHILGMSEFRSLVAEIEEEGLLNATDRILIYNLLDAGNTEVEHIMTPRTRIQFAGADMKLSEAAEIMKTRRRLRIPVYQETRDNVTGFIHAEEILKKINEGEDLAAMTCMDVIRPPLFVPLTKSVDETLDFFQKHNERSALVLNEFGGISGLVTMEDVLNFIFGEIAGEFINDYDYTEEEENVFVVTGNMKLNDFESLTNFGIEDHRMTTIGGVALRHLGKLPVEGDTAVVEGIRMTVLEMKGNSIAKLRVARVDDLENDKKESSETSGFKEQPAAGTKKETV